MKLPLGVCAVLIVAAAAADQLVKSTVETVMPLGEMRPLLPFLALLRAHNEGVAFSFLEGSGPALLIAMTLVISVGAIIYLVRTPVDALTARFGLALILGGALGNLIDRVRLGYVIDYIFFHTPMWSFAIFNLADVFISVGAALVFFDEIFLKSRRQAPAEN